MSPRIAIHLVPIPPVRCATIAVRLVEQASCSDTAKLRRLYFMNFCLVENCSRLPGIEGGLHVLQSMLQHAVAVHAWRWKAVQPEAAYQMVVS